jgi:ribosomal protein S18 acetylase RimI-like enzyme
MAFEVRPVRPEDYEALGNVTADVYAVAYPPIEEAREAVRKMHDVAARVAGSETTFVAAESTSGGPSTQAATGTGKILGGVSFLVHDNELADVARPGEGEIRLLAVDPRARRQGIGRALVRACLDRAAALGLERMVLSTQEDMVEAQQLYDRMGFKRALDREWEPVPGVRLRAYVMEIPN